MSSANQAPPRTPFKRPATGAAPTSSFLQQRDALIKDIGVVGNEFGAVEALWSQFENVMAKEPGQGENGDAEGDDGAEEEDQEKDPDTTDHGNKKEESK
ncbi:MAG: hypothetical protein Q9170_001031 [Blastenia crenularia]